MRTLTFFLLSTAFAASAFAYQYPIGIPPAWMDPDATRPARPSSWTTEVPGYYYVSEATGTDTGRTYGTPNAPRKTIPNPIPAGSYVEVNGTYTMNSGGKTPIVGAANIHTWVANTDGPAWVVGLDADHRPTFTSPVGLYGTGVCVDQIAAKSVTINSHTAAAQLSASYILLRNSEFAGGNTDVSNTSAITIDGSTYSTSQNIIVYNNSVHDWGPTLTAPDSDRDDDGIILNGYVDHAWILDNHVYAMDGTGVAVGADTNIDTTTGNARINYVFVGRNNVHDVWAAGLAYKSSNHVVYSQNTVHDVVDTTWSESKGIGGQYAGLESWILYNTIYNCNYGIRIESTTSTNIESVYIVGNLIHDIFLSRSTGIALNTSSFGEAALGVWGADKRFIIGNTIRGAPRGLSMPNQPAPTGLDPLAAIIENNIFTECLAEDIYIENNSSSAIVNNNVFFRLAGSPKVKLGSATFTIDALPSAYTGNVLRDPLFLDPTSGNYRVRSEVPLFTASSMTRNVFTDYNTSIGVTVPVRTYSDLIDVVPDAPTNLTVHP